MRRCRYSDAGPRMISMPDDVFSTVGWVSIPGTRSFGWAATELALFTTVRGPTAEVPPATMPGWPSPWDVAGTVAV